MKPVATLNQFNHFRQTSSKLIKRLSQDLIVLSRQNMKELERQQRFLLNNS